MSGAAMMLGAPAFRSDEVWSFTPWLFAAMSLVLGIGALVFSVGLLIRSRDAVPLTLWAGGFVAAFVAEPLLGHLDQLAWSSGYPGPTFGGFGTRIPFFVPFVYAFYLGMSGYVGSRLMRRGLSIRGVWGLWAALVGADVVLQLVAVNLKAYVYYGAQPFVVLHLPLVTSFKNGTAYLAIGLLAWALTARLRGWTTTLVALVPLTAYLAGAVSTAWPWYVAVNSEVSGGAAAALAALSVVLCTLGAHAAVLIVGVDSPWRKATTTTMSRTLGAVG